MSSYVKLPEGNHDPYVDGYLRGIACIYIAHFQTQPYWKILNAGWITELVHQNSVEEIKHWYFAESVPHPMSITINYRHMLLSMSKIRVYLKKNNVLIPKCMCKLSVALLILPFCGLSSPFHVQTQPDSYGELYIIYHIIHYIPLKSN